MIASDIAPFNPITAEDLQYGIEASVLPLSNTSGCAASGVLLAHSR